MEVKLLNAPENPERAICQAARNDYMEEWIGDKTFEEVMDGVDGETTDESVETLIHHLLKHGHFGPFEHPKAVFAVKGISRSCMAQITRHRHASFDVQSMRYVGFALDSDEDIDEKVVSIPELEDPGITGRNAEFSEQIEEMDLSDERVLSSRQMEYWTAMKESFRSYSNLLDLGVAPENARMVLPIGTRVNMVLSLNPRMVLHVADMRAAADAQWEIREMTERILEIATEWIPVTMDYYDENMKNRKNRLAP